jgi:TPP-dependent pyruvate/acetoin dehydrogenase alpha subunit
VGPREDQDVGVRRKADLAEWKKRDPIGRLAQALCQVGHCAEADLAAMERQVRTSVEDAWSEALESPLALEAATMSAVYASEARHGVSP